MVLVEFFRVLSKTAGETGFSANQAVSGWAIGDTAHTLLGPGGLQSG